MQELEYLSIISGLIYNLSIIYGFHWNTVLICWLILFLFSPCPTIVKYGWDVQCIKSGSLTLHLSLPEKFSNTKLFLVRIFPHSDWIRIQSECRKIRTRNNSLFGHFSRSASYSKNLWKKRNHRILMMKCCSISGDN